MLKDEYGVDFKDMTWVYGAVEPSAITRPEKVKLELPLDITPIPQGKCLAQVGKLWLWSSLSTAKSPKLQMLADGEIDVLFTA